MSTRQDVVAVSGSSIDLVGGLSARELVSFVSDVLVTEEGQDQRLEQVEERAALSAVIDRLKPPFSLPRLQAALRVVLREEPRPVEGSLLTTDEFDVLSELYGDELRQRTRVIERVYRLERALNALVAFSDVTRTHTGKVDADLQLIEIERTSDLHMFDIAAELVIQRLLRQFESSRGSSSADVVFVVGADRVRRRTFETMLDFSEHADVQFVPIFARLRDHAIDALGGGATCAIMRLTDPREASQAADFIGREYKFVLSQSTRTRGESYDRSTGTTSGVDMNMSDSRSAGMNFNRQLTMGMSMSSGQSATSSSSVNSSDAETDQRVYELAVEPREIQGLPETGMFLIELAADRVVPVDCDPTVLTRPRVYGSSGMPAPLLDTARPAIAARPAGPVDINEATMAELAALPGMNDALARRAMTVREQHGPYTSPQEFALFLDLAPHVFAGLLPLIRAERSEDPTESQPRSGRIVDY